MGSFFHAVQGRSERITGNLFHAARALAGMTRNDLAARARLSRDVLYSWETSSDAIVPAQYRQLCRAIDALEDAGVRFADDGVFLDQPASSAHFQQGRRGNLLHALTTEFWDRGFQIGQPDRALRRGWPSAHNWQRH